MENKPEERLQQSLVALECRVQEALRKGTIDDSAVIRRVVELRRSGVFAHPYSRWEDHESGGRTYRLDVRLPDGTVETFGEALQIAVDVDRAVALLVAFANAAEWEEDAAAWDDPEDYLDSIPLMFEARKILDEAGIPWKRG